MQISATKITTYLDCPLRYRFRYVDQIEPDQMSPNMAFGSVFHRSAKFIHRKRMDGVQLTREQMETAFRLDWTAAQTVPIKWNGSSPESLEEQGLAMLRTYLDAMEDVGAPLAVEAEIKVPFVNLATGEKMPDVELFGYIDRITRDHEPVELKTSGRSWSTMMADQSLQMTLYAYALALQHEREEVTGQFEVIVKNKTPKFQRLETVRNVRDFDQMYRTVERVLEAVDAGLFFPAKGFLCPSCDFSAECYRW
ncbi:MAG TPA: PD-(D/E)XK nuclease family protein [candidate division Zixibacteria bacterium]|nr:PD-(D/E)XK nuclease family protein [candidate division Zixibacteria bacterium]